MSNSHPKLVISVVYQSKDGLWRGFCSPYDVTCEAYTANEAIKKLDDLVELYEDGLKKYGYPQHLAFKPLSNKKDQIMFTVALKSVMEDFEKKITKSYLEYQKNKEREEIKLHNPSRFVNYYQPCYAQ